ncbi:MAG: aldo/keto reductase, partial [Microcystaceae cyanobacterium]
MRYRRFGKTNWPLSVFSLGTMGCLTAPMVMKETVETAIALGINHFETARGYGKSEIYLGQVLKHIPRQNFYLTTKICPTVSSAQMENAIAESLARLQVDYLDGLALHGINTEEHFEQISRSDGCMQAIKKAITQGKIRHLGFSTHGSLDLILKTINTDLFD